MADNSGRVPGAPQYSQDQAEELIRRNSSGQFPSSDWGVFSSQPSTSGELTSRSVETVRINPFTGMPYNPTMSATAEGSIRPAANASVSAALRAPGKTGTQYFNEPGIDYGFNTVTQEYEPKQPGNAYTDMQAPRGWGAKPNPAVAAIETAARPSMPTKPRWGAMLPAGRPPTGPVQLSFEPMSEQSAQRLAANMGGRGFITPSGKVYGGTGKPIMISGGGGPAPAAPVMRPGLSPLQQQAQASLTPAGGFQPVSAPGQRSDVFGNDMAFQPQSVQRSTRMNTGY